ncbi:DUF2634 domain-containing protein [Tissierella sp. MSJ-40]|uniref:DUF2634 domain-containing protein n=1 Tax=Tissierella simiarum TaxID=2841534 RepID=A0ABS6EBY8_9FIRM|nr:DUF2634 domain-containing protein [Tissierella simiarum]MBU5440284.1 DUF2634 domain-containing protein [Tissierella simiarum]
MLPQQEVVYSDELEVINMPSLTYKLDFENGNIEGTIDGMEAMEQVIDKIINTARYYHKIYPDWYGNEIYSLIGQDRLYVESEIERMIKEALLTDDRIIEIKDFTILDGEGQESILVRFTVHTIFGEIKVKKEVDI